MKMKQATERKREECHARGWTLSRNGETIKLRDIADKIAHWINAFKEIGDAVAQLDPLHVALPWAAFRFLLEVSYPTFTLIFREIH